MKIKKLALLTFALTLNIVQAQELKFTLGPSVGYSMNGQGFLNTTQRKVYYLSEGRQALKVGSVLTVTPITEYLEPTKSLPIQSEMMAMDNVSLERWLAIEDKNYLVYSISDKKKDELTVYLQELSANMVLLGSALKLATFTDIKDDANKVPAYLERYSVRTNFVHVYASENGKQLLMIKQRKTKVEMKAFALDKGPLWTKTFDLIDSKYELNMCQVTNSGNIYLLGEQGDNAPFLIAHNPLTNTSKNTKINTGDKVEDFGYTLKLFDDTPFLVGLSDLRKIDGQKQVGYQVLKINPSTLSLDTVGFGKVNEPFVKYMHKLGSKPQIFSVKNVVLRNDGGVAFSIEGAVAQVNREYGWTTWIYSALGVIALDKTGAEQWNIIIEKEQVQGADTFVGHNLFSSGGKVFVLYNDNTENFDLLPTVKPKERALKKKIYVSVAEIDDTGKAKKLKPLTNDKNKFSAVEIKDTRKISDNLYQVFLKVEENYHFAMLSIE